MEEKGTPLSEIGLYGLMERYNRNAAFKHPSTQVGTGDDAVVVKPDGGYQLLTQVLFLEGIHFDRVYTPLRHLGYKVVVAALADLLAMNGTPRQLVVSLGLSSRMTLEMVDELMDGVLTACERYQIDLAGVRPTSSLTGLTIGVSLTGRADSRKLLLRSKGKPTDVLCVTGDLGSAFMGLQLLEREKRVLRGHEGGEPDFGNSDYVLERQLKPEAKTWVAQALSKLKVQPTAMINVRDGLAAALLLLCQASGTGCRIHEKKIPLHQITLKVAHEMNFNPLVAALNGGEDYELLFSLSLNDYERVMDRFPENISVIGYLTDAAKGCRIITGSEQEIDLKAQGWRNS